MNMSQPRVRKLQAFTSDPFPSAGCDIKHPADGVILFSR
ncbi:hypothetical protein ASAP_0279 [Asaia bogorensis]|uniref:Uncharacterized protein n=1 Tax=Asaia bogorensis TaxID=91915 RepID=A0A060QB32_9PROT|nr:hypothetical protein ASAP_0279 [Asaia bogorensis]